MEIQKVIQTIQDLCRKTVRNGCTENEAMSAAEKIGQLMKVYNLSMDKVFLGETKCIQSAIETGRRRRHPIDGCVKAIAEFCDCRVWFSGYGQKSYQLFGLPTDIEMAKYLYGIVFDAMETAIAEFKGSEAYQLSQGNFGIKTSRKTLSVSFQKGMASRIYHRLVEMMDIRHEEESSEAPDIIDPDTGLSTGTSLIVVKRDKVKSEFEQLGIRLKKAATSASYNDRSAFSKGQEAGNKVNLNRPIGRTTGYLT
jgi:hypothetical protein